LKKRKKRGCRGRKKSGGGIIIGGVKGFELGEIDQSDGKGEKKVERN